jgi:hypothetical protein
MFDLSTFKIRPARSVALSLKAMPSSQGTYTLLIPMDDNPIRGLIAAMGGRAPDAIAGLDLIYVGATADPIGSRLKCHLKGDSRTSTARMSLGLMLRHHLGLEPQAIPGKRYFFFADEQRLTDWMLATMLVGIKLADDPFGIERAIVAGGHSFLNLAGTPPTALTKHLSGLRRACRIQTLAPVGGPAHVPTWLPAGRMPGPPKDDSGGPVS